MQAEVVALVLPDADSGRTNAHAQLLMRGADGQMWLQNVSPDSTLGQHAMSSGCFRQGAPIIDPVTRETVGYEMEAVASPLAQLAPTELISLSSRT
jgi:hypothetical protein